METQSVQFERRKTSFIIFPFDKIRSYININQADSLGYIETDSTKEILGILKQL